MLSLGETVLEARGVAKIYSRSSSATHTRVARDIRSALFADKSDQAELRENEFWALRNINLTVRRGEALGIIGLNGSGKTTLLRILAGQIVPDGGVVRLWGATASMIDLTAGFQLAASGRRNVYLRSAALGRSTAEADAALDEIIAFTELGDAIDAPVATYSSGMIMRLAFAIMTVTTPDILFIDEVLAVGDFRFRQKCLARLREMREDSSFVMVSHAMSDVERFCDTVIVIDKGQAVFEGAAKDATTYYLENIETPVTTPAQQKAAVVEKALGHQLEMGSALSAVAFEWCDASGRPKSEFNRDEEIFSECTIDLPTKLRNLTIGIPVYNESGLYIAGFASREVYFDGLPNSVGRNTIRMSVAAHYFPPGIYHCNLVIRDGVEHLYRKRAASFQVLPDPSGVYGAVNIPHKWSVEA